MRVLVITTRPLAPAIEPSPLVAAIPELRRRGADPFLAAPVIGDPATARLEQRVTGLLPLLPSGDRDAPRLAANLVRVAVWARRWGVLRLLADGPGAAMMAIAGRGAAGGGARSVFYLERLRYEGAGPLWRALERRAIQEADRLITPDERLARRLVTSMGARRADVAALPDPNPTALVELCEQFFEEPTAFRYSSSR